MLKDGRRSYVGTVYGGLDPMNKTRKSYGYTCLTWSTFRDVHYFEIQKGVDEVSKRGEWFAIEPISFIVGIVCALKGSYPIKIFMCQRHLVQQMFNFN